MDGIMSPHVDWLSVNANYISISCFIELGSSDTYGLDYEMD
jgi:hypothetical protein